MTAEDRDIIETHIEVRFAGERSSADDTYHLMVRDTREVIDEFVRVTRRDHWIRERKVVWETVAEVRETWPALLERGTESARGTTIDWTSASLQAAVLLGIDRGMSSSALATVLNAYFGSTLTGDAVQKKIQVIKRNRSQDHGEQDDLLTEAIAAASVTSSARLAKARIRS